MQTALKNDRSNRILDEEFKETKKNVEILMTAAKKGHFKNEFIKCKGNSGATWGVIEDLIPGLKNIGNSTIYDDPQLKANEFNEYFAKVGEIAFKKSQEGYQKLTSDVNTNATNHLLE